MLFPRAHSDREMLLALGSILNLAREFDKVFPTTANVGVGIHRREERHVILTITR